LENPKSNTICEANSVCPSEKATVLIGLGVATIYNQDVALW